ncbi:branched-chain amino acid ABC transporter ATP-binding protein [Bradyrhizobium nitroreducens]|uniref:Branched-chain amino acid ABC transporter ATP-binding protein n=1 Tax=Bradyrhizobium nitroreducens TaxID=709803 RepID=A0A2M6UH99_9BRAD|nr:ABC transporter ATP-binding protein [Bradyrhizobium nitroreducens]PIT03915.1 branched-chain amino acid ABC transporter ATP-binding protein [Bradyrhizobium nitroreducens]
MPQTRTLRRATVARKTRVDYLKLDNVQVVYNGMILVLRGVSMRVPCGKIVTLLGANGAGKTTTLKAISNLLAAERGALSGGSIHFEGRRVDDLGPEALVRSGLIQVMEGRRCFPHLTIEENLLTGAHTRSARRSELNAGLEKIFHYFPRLKVKRRLSAGYASGGEQQMCAIGRALMSNPRMVLLDEPSMGLAPQIVQEIFAIVRDLNQRERVTFLIAEQNATLALDCADFGYVIENGRVVMDGTAQTLKDSSEVREFYLGIGSGERRNFADLSKSHRRRRPFLSVED